MWTLDLTSLKVAPSVKFPTMMNLQANYVNGAQTVSIETEVSTADEVKSTLRANLDRLNEREDVLTAVKAGTFSITPLQPDTPTVEEQAKAEWFSRYNRYKKAQNLVSEGLLNATDLDTAKAWLKTNYKPDYSDGI